MNNIIYELHKEQMIFGITASGLLKPSQMNNIRFIHCLSLLTKLKLLWDIKNTEKKQKSSNLTLLHYSFQKHGKRKKSRSMLHQAMTGGNMQIECKFEQPVK